MTYPSRQTVIAAFALAASLSLMLAGSPSASTTGKVARPVGQWAIGYHAYMGPGFRSVPAMVFSVTSNVDKGVTEVFVRNKAAEAVTAVKLRWSLSLDNMRGDILRQGETPRINLKEKLQPGADVKLGYQVVTFEEIYRPLLKEGRLDGDFRVEIAVSEVEFANGASWKWGDPFTQKVTFTRQLGKCANQTCKNISGVYNCVDGAGELCTNSGESCNSSLCDTLIE